MPRETPPDGHVLRELGRILKRVRLSRGMTVEQLAAIVGVGRSTYAYYESGDREPPIETLIRIANAADTPLSALLYPLDDFVVPVREVRIVADRRRDPPKA